jgi:Coenzyme PQQ synthesis protein D (PqqD)
MGDHSSSLPDGARIARSPDALDADIDDEVVLLSMETGYFHQLNEVAAYLWKQVERERTIAELLHAACQTFDADERECREDIESFVASLRAAGLVTVS